MRKVIQTDQPLGHDEIACCCRAEFADKVGEILVRNAKQVGSIISCRYHLIVPTR
jgi:hypothetical protein